MTDREIRIRLYGPEPVFPLSGTRWSDVNGDAAIPLSLDWGKLFSGPKVNQRAHRRFNLKRRHWANQRIDEFFGAAGPRGPVPAAVQAEYGKYGLKAPVFWFVDQPDEKIPAFKKSGESFVPIMIDGVQAIVSKPRQAEHLARFPDGPIHGVDAIDDYDAFAAAVIDPKRADEVIAYYQDKQVQTAVKFKLAGLIPTLWHPETSGNTQGDAQDLLDSLAA